MYDEMIFNRVKNAFDLEKMIFFVGAGISVNSGVPKFGKLNRIVIPTIVNRKLNVGTISQETSEHERGK